MIIESIIGLFGVIFITGIWIALVYEVTTSLTELTKEGVSNYSQRFSARFIGSVRLGICIMVFTVMMHYLGF